LHVERAVLGFDHDFHARIIRATIESANIMR
jgi:hypothetical protein